MPDTAAALCCRGLVVRAGGATLVDGLSFSLPAGQRLAVLGRNGAGKTTLMHTLAGLAPPAAGHVELAGQPLAGQHRTRVARRMALMMQTCEDPFPTTVLEMALIGRHPHLGLFQWERDADRAAARAALARVGLAGLADRSIDTLSGGERRRLALATVLCQDPELYLLDEPLNHLDVRHQLETLALFDGLAANGAALVASIHDLNFAARFADSALLLYGAQEGGRWMFGAAADVLEPGALSALLDAPVRVVDDAGRRVFVTG